MVFCPFASDAAAMFSDGSSEPEWVVALHGVPFYAVSPSIQINKPEREDHLFQQGFMALCVGNLRRAVNSPHSS